MRKLLKITTTFAFALFLTAGMAFGQNNSSDVEQRGSQLGATVNQTGNDLKGNIYQGQLNGGNFGFAAKKSDAAISQEGGGATANIYQGVNDALVAKSEARIIQNGTAASSNLNATIVQGGNSKPGNSTKAEANSFAKIDQTGVNHTARVNQAVDEASVAQKSEARVTQLGGKSGSSNMNTAKVNQARGGGFTENVEATVYQNGYALTGKILQGVGGSSATMSSASIVQHGDNNSARVVQSN